MMAITALLLLSQGKLGSVPAALVLSLQEFVCIGELPHKLDVGLQSFAVLPDRSADGVKGCLVLQRLGFVSANGLLYLTQRRPDFLNCAPGVDLFTHIGKDFQDAISAVG
jgi:hypothetical protein